LPGIHDEQVEAFTYCKFIFGSTHFFPFHENFSWGMQGSSEDPSKSNTGDGSSGHAVNPSDEVVLNIYVYVCIEKMKAYNELL